ncbi:MAG: helix-turn-helix domain-containing protein [Propionibacteriaceae bacterium]|nr:helix-turn-helix domain-containing protein [Propionibacteriaceae bacterium]
MVKTKSESARSASTSALQSCNRSDDTTVPSLQTPNSLYVSRAEVGTILGVGPRHVEKLEQAGELIAHQFGRCVRYKRDDVLAWAERQAR